MRHVQKKSIHRTYTVAKLGVRRTYVEGAASAGLLLEGARDRNSDDRSHQIRPVRALHDCVHTHTCTDHARRSAPSSCRSVRALPPHARLLRTSLAHQLDSLKRPVSRRVATVSYTSSFASRISSVCTGSHSLRPALAASPSCHTAGPSADGLRGGRCVTSPRVEAGARVHG